jgi:hypothetical protein
MQNLSVVRLKLGRNIRSDGDFFKARALTGSSIMIKLSQVLQAPVTIRLPLSPVVLHFQRRRLFKE